MKRLGVLLVVMVTVCTAATPALASRLYGIGSNDNSGLVGGTFSVSQTTGQADLVGLAGDRTNWASGLAYDSSTGTLYVANIYHDQGGSLFPSLGTVDPTSGLLTFIGNHLTSVDGLAYDSTNDVLYGLTTGATGGPTATLYTIDRSTAAATVVGSLGVTFGSPGHAALDYDSDTKTLYAADPSLDLTYRVDPATGAATLLGSTGSSINVGGLASIPTFSNIPTLGVAGLVALFVALALIGTVAVRRLL